MSKNAERIRTTISIDKDVHQIFVAMAEAGGMSVSRCMGEWLSDTAEGAQFVALKMQEAKRAPKAVMRELQAAASGLGGEVADLFTELRAGKSADKVPARSRARTATLSAASTSAKAPSSNTGLKYPSSSKK